MPPKDSAANKRNGGDRGGNGSRSNNHHNSANTNKANDTTAAAANNTNGAANSARRPSKGSASRSAHHHDHHHDGTNDDNGRRPHDRTAHASANTTCNISGGRGRRDTSAAAPPTILITNASSGVAVRAEVRCFVANGGLTRATDANGGRGQLCRKMRGCPNVVTCTYLHLKKEYAHLATAAAATVGDKYGAAPRVVAPLTLTSGEQMEVDEIANSSSGAAPMASQVETLTRILARGPIADYVLFKALKSVAERPLPSDKPSVDAAGKFFAAVVKWLELHGTSVASKIASEKGRVVAFFVDLLVILFGRVGKTSSFLSAVVHTCRCIAGSDPEAAVKAKCEKLLSDVDVEHARLEPTTVKRPKSYRSVSSIARYVDDGSPHIGEMAIFPNPRVHREGQITSLHGIVVDHPIPLADAPLHLKYQFSLMRADYAASLEKGMWVARSVFGPLVKAKKAIMMRDVVAPVARGRGGGGRGGGRPTDTAGAAAGTARLEGSVQAALKAADVDRVCRMYHRLLFVSLEPARGAVGGVIMKFKLDVTQFPDPTILQGGKRLMHGNLLALSRSWFADPDEAIVFGTIYQERTGGNAKRGRHNQSPSSNDPSSNDHNVPAAGAGFMSLAVILDPAVVRIEELLSRLAVNDSFQALESQVFFTPYHRVLESLQFLGRLQGGLPLGQELLLGRTRATPQYLLKAGHLTVHEAVVLKGEVGERRYAVAGGGLTALLQPWSETLERQLSGTGNISKRLHVLDATQSLALQHIFTHSVAIVQGTPGTGKTFIGGKVMQILLSNVAKGLVDCGPILVIGQTNHAVDAVIEDIAPHLVGPTALARLGAGSKSDAVAALSTFKAVLGDSAKSYVSRKESFKLYSDMDTQREKFADGRRALAMIAAIARGDTGTSSEVMEALRKDLLEDLQRRFDGADGCPFAQEQRDARQALADASREINTNQRRLRKVEAAVEAAVAAGLDETAARRVLMRWDDLEGAALNDRFRTVFFDALRILMKEAEEVTAATNGDAATPSSASIGVPSLAQAPRRLGWLRSIFNVMVPILAPAAKAVGAAVVSVAAPSPLAAPSPSAALRTLEQRVTNALARGNLAASDEFSHVLRDLVGRLGSLLDSLQRSKKDIAGTVASREADLGSLRRQMQAKKSAAKAAPGGKGKGTDKRRKGKGGSLPTGAAGDSALNVSGDSATQDQVLQTAATCDGQQGADGGVGAGSTTAPDYDDDDADVDDGDDDDDDDEGALPSYGCGDDDEEDLSQAALHEQQIADGKRTLADLADAVKVCGDAQRSIADLLVDMQHPAHSRLDAQSTLDHFAKRNKLTANQKRFLQLNTEAEARVKALSVRNWRCGKGALTPSETEAVRAEVQRAIFDASRDYDEDYDAAAVLTSAADEDDDARARRQAQAYIRQGAEADRAGADSDDDGGESWGSGDVWEGGGEDEEEAALSLFNETLLAPDTKFTREKIFQCLCWIHIFDHSKLVREALVYIAKNSEGLRKLDDAHKASCLKKFSVIAATTTGCAGMLSVMQLIQPRVIIVEEAAEVLESHVLACLSPGTQHLILIGDHKQLQPKISEEMTLGVNKNLTVSLMERLVRMGAPYVTLTTQRRMHPHISAFHKPYYLETLPHETPAKVEDHPRTLMIPEPLGVADRVRVVCIGHCGEGPMAESFDEGMQSYSNDYESSLACAIYLHLQRANPSATITVIVPYAAHTVNTIRLASTYGIILRRGSKAAGHAARSTAAPSSGHTDTHSIGLRVASIDDYQGEEDDFVILCLARTASDGLRRGFLKMPDRVCVALSRAKRGMYVIGSLRALEGAANPLWINFLRELRAREKSGAPQPLIRSTFPAVCVVHDVDLSFASYAEFKQRVCTKMCAQAMGCGHTCQLLCHVGEACKVSRCTQPCTRTRAECQPKRQCSHPCTRRCNDKECGPCEVIVQKTCDACGGVADYPCKGTVDNVASCKASITRVSPCGHTVTAPCHAWVAGRAHTACKAKCGMRMPCGHVCPEKCHHLRDADHAEGSRRCRVLKTVTHPRCGVHSVTVACGLAADQYPKCVGPCDGAAKCGHRCELECSATVHGGGGHAHDCSRPTSRVLARCGHTHHEDVPCNAADPTCAKACAYIHPCGHPCSGTCGECPRGNERFLRDHKQCNFVCGKVLLCGHTCSGGGCSHDVCPPCTHPAGCKWFACGHATLCATGKHTCGQCDAARCQMDCDWVCPHQGRCSEKCFAACTRAVCDAPCPEGGASASSSGPSPILPCGHAKGPCVGVCGEQCPTFCRECYRADGKAYNGYRRFQSMGLLLQNAAEENSCLLGDLSFLGVGGAGADGAVPCAKGVSEASYRLVELPCCGGLFLSGELEAWVRTSLGVDDDGDVAAVRPLSVPVLCPSHTCSKPMLPHYFKRVGGLIRQHWLDIRHVMHRETEAAKLRVAISGGDLEALLVGSGLFERGFLHDLLKAAELAFTAKEPILPPRAAGGKGKGKGARHDDAAELLFQKTKYSEERTKWTEARDASAKALGECFTANLGAKLGGVALPGVANATQHLGTFMAKVTGLALGARGANHGSEVEHQIRCLSMSLGIASALMAVAQMTSGGDGCAVTRSHGDDGYVDALLRIVDELTRVEGDSKSRQACVASKGPFVAAVHTHAALVGAARGYAATAVVDKGSPRHLVPRMRYNSAFDKFVTNDLMNGAKAFFAAHNSFFRGKGSAQFLPNPCLARACSAYQRLFKPWVEKGKAACPIVYGFHGTSADAIGPICCRGLDVARRRGQVHGPGEYFGLTPLISEEYARDSEGMLVCAIIDDPSVVTKNSRQMIIVNNPLHDPSRAFVIPMGIATWRRDTRSLQRGTCSYPVPVLPQALVAHRRLLEDLLGYIVAGAQQQSSSSSSSSTSTSSSPFPTGFTQAMASQISNAVQWLTDHSTHAVYAVERFGYLAPLMAAGTAGGDKGGGGAKKGTAALIGSCLPDNGRGRAWLKCKRRGHIYAYAGAPDALYSSGLACCPMCVGLPTDADNSDVSPDE